MAKVDLGSIAERLFLGFIAPLVAGGEMHPGRPIGGRAALAIGVQRTVTDIDRYAHVQLARVRCARKLVPVDRVEDLSESEWALAACLHDVVQSTHPSLMGAFRGKTPTKLLDLVELTLGRIPSAKNAAEALSRHTLFSRLFEIERTDTTVSWWVGSSTFLGSVPPERLTKWPDLRRVNVVRTPRALTELPAYGGAVRADRFSEVMTKFLNKTPLTDLATMHRKEPAFGWSAETLALADSRAGRTLVTRSLRAAPEEALHASLGRSLKRLLAARSWKEAHVVLTILGERTLADAQLVASEGRPELSTSNAWSEDAMFARAAGALVAERELLAKAQVFQADERERLLLILAPAAAARARHELEAFLAIPPDAPETGTLTS
jgi:hypothetical protein